MQFWASTISIWNPLIQFARMPAMRAIGKTPYANVFRAAGLSQLVSAAGLDVLATEVHATRGMKPVPTSWRGRGNL